MNKQKSTKPETVGAKPGCAASGLLGCIVVELPYPDKKTEWGVSFAGPHPPEEKWVPCESEEIAWRLKNLVDALLTSCAAQSNPASNLQTRPD
jgi:hypothetical protein